MSGQDLIEDLCIAYGYEHITPINPQLSTVSKLLPTTKMSDLLREFMLGFSFTETTSYHLISSEDQEFWNDNDYVKILDSLGDYNSVRNSLIVNVMNTLKRNRQYSYPQKVYEIGTVTNTSFDDRKHLCITHAGDGARTVY